MNAINLQYIKRLQVKLRCKMMSLDFDIAYLHVCKDIQLHGFQHMQMKWSNHSQQKRD